MEFCQDLLYFVFISCLSIASASATEYSVAMPKQILVLSASVGAGHLRAAQAVELALKQLAPDAFIQNVDILTLTNILFRKLYGQAYLDLVNKAPHLLGYFYDMLDKPQKVDSKREKLRFLVQKFNLSKFDDLLESRDWDCIVNTHFLPSELIAAKKKKGKCAIPQITATTDFETHRLWVNLPCERYFTATEEGAENLASWGIPRDTIQSVGIPIHPIFSKPVNRQECLENQGLKGDRPILLQLAGGFGVGPVAKITSSLLNLSTPVELVVVAGKNANAKKAVEEIPVPSQHRIKVMGFTDQMDQLMGVADLIVTKPGGLTTSETLARGAAMAILNPIPGQESRNSDYLLENSAAIKINNLSTMTYKLQALLSDPGKLKSLKTNAKKLGKPKAAFDVARAALEM